MLTCRSEAVMCYVGEDASLHSLMNEAGSLKAPESETPVNLTTSTRSAAG